MGVKGKMRVQKIHGSTGENGNTGDLVRVRSQGNKSENRGYRRVQGMHGSTGGVRGDTGRYMVTAGA